MTTLLRSYLLADPYTCHSIEIAADFVNGGTSDGMTAEELAGQYAFDCLKEDGLDYEWVNEGIIAHLDYLAEAGANFDSKEAIKNAVARLVEAGMLI